MRRLVGRDVLGAPRAGGRARCAHGERPRCAQGDAHGDAPGDAGRRGRRPLPQMSPWPPCARAAPTGGRDASAGRARRPRRAARTGTRTLRARGRSGDAGRRGRRPLPQMSPWPPCARAAPAGGRDAPAGRARRPRRAARRGTSTLRARGRPGGRGPPGTSAPTTNAPVAAMRPCRPGGGTGCAAGRARRPRRAARRGTCTLRARGVHAACMGTPRGTRAAGDVGHYHKRPRGRHAPVPPRRGNGMRRLVGRDVLGAPRAWGRARCAHGDVHAACMGTPRGTRAAEDVGPYHKRPRVRHAPVPPRRGNGMRRLVGRDVLGAPRAGGRARCAHGDVHARMGTPRGTRAAGDVGPYHAISSQRHGYSRNFHVSGEHRIVATFKGNLSL